jgi:hypothetical protein
MSTHTPAPWEAGRGEWQTLVDGVGSKWIYAGEQYVAVASGRIDGDWAEVMANARLIAAAPELLQATKHLVAIFAGLDEAAISRTYGTGDMLTVRRAKAAVAKAEAQS